MTGDPHAAAAGDGRWALSFADLCLLLLAFFIVLQARSVDRAAVARGVRAAFGNQAGATTRQHAFEARALFLPGEAVLRADARARLAVLARGSATARVESSGRDQAGQRFDGWELAAARTAAVARALAATGMAPDRISVAMPAMDGPAGGQRFTIIIG